ncbi:MAG: hypothetical protein QOI41_5354 [Myxococcales bacterium]|nr:hypothetical protein [Myxococcales bacterium]
MRARRGQRERTKRKAPALAAGLLLCLATSPVAAPRTAHAGGPLGPQGTPIQTSNYTLDLFQGPVLASSRVTGMAGAYSALAEGAEGIPFNAAAASQRYGYSTTRTDWELTGGVTFPASVASTDFDNNGKTGFGYHDFVWATGGGFLQHDHWGFGAIVSAQSYSLGAPPQLGLDGTGVKDLTVRIFKVDAVASYGFLDDQLHIGGGLRGAVFTAVDTSSGEKLLLGTYGIGAQAGALWRPHHLPLRLGGTIRSPVIGTITSSPNVDQDPKSGDRVVGRFFLPSGVDLPWELEGGVAIQLGPRPLNIQWIDEDTVDDPEIEEERRLIPATSTVPAHLEPSYKSARRVLRRRYRDIPRDKVLLSFSMLVTGPTKGAVGVESMLTQVIDRSGERSSVTLRGGTEVEVVPNRLQLRAGSYMEPTRFRQSSPRLHATTGFEVRVVDWSLFGIFPEDNAFRISGAVDVSREYFGWSLGIGSWF